MNKIFNTFKKKEKNHVSKCCNRKEFILDDYLYNQIMSNEAVIFAGAGISTESKKIIPNTLFSSLA